MSKALHNARNSIALIICIAFVLSLLSITIFVSAAETNLQASVVVLQPTSFLMVNNPINGKTYNATQIVLDISVIEQVKVLSYILNNGKETVACRNCLGYVGTISAKEGVNNLTAIAQKMDRTYVYNTSIFYVNTSTAPPNDTNPPKILATFPSKTGNGMFGVQYTEDNLNKVMLYYGPSLENSVEFTGCTSGKNIWCYNNVDVSQYNGLKSGIFYQFEVVDHQSSTLSSKVKIKIDTSATAMSLEDDETLSFTGKIKNFFKKLFRKD